MKKALQVFLMLMITSSFMKAQTNEQPYSFGILGGLTQYNGDLGQGFYDFSQGSYGHAGISFAAYINEHWDFATNATFGSIGYKEDDFKRFRGEQIQWNAHFRLNVLSSDKYKLIPYFFGGIGIADYKNYTIKPGTDITVPFGAGLRYRITERINLTLQETFAYSDHDNRDYETNNNNDGFLMHSFGISYLFGNNADADKDGVADKKDKCPDTPLGVKVDSHGCPLDRDGDGITDDKDLCPDVKGQASAKGCPDRDGDGITDADDACPDVAGLAAMKGCPDRDGDGITDADDKCPDLKGTIALKGCPDTDGDGIIDPDDACPTEKGLASLKGCPDRDGDGIADKDDKCPDVAGIAANKGCPEIKDDVNKLFAKALQGIQFETGKDVIRKPSYSILDNVVKVMQENPAYLLSIDGHTDNTGDKTKNMTLSQKRADAVKAYLVSKGVAGSRLTSTGFGDTKPVGDNNTEAGRSKNRRVEFKVSF